MSEHDTPPGDGWSGYDVEPAETRSDAVPAPPVQQVEDETHCVGCSYDLRGLHVTSRCPECGLEVDRSLRGNLLRWSTPAYLEPLHRGALVVIVATIGQFVLAVIGIIVGIAVAVAAGGGAAAPDALGAVEFVLTGLDAALALAFVFGFWLFSTPDPSILTGDTGDLSRRLLRISVCVLAAAKIFAVLVHPVVLPLADPTLMLVLKATGGTVAFLATALWYFTSVLYMRWLARRVPSRPMEEEATRLLWLGPLLYTVGSCVVVGPIVAWILYLILLNRLRIAIRGFLPERDESVMEMPSGFSP